MSNDIGSYPGAGKFRSLVGIIIVVILIRLFFVYTDSWEAAVELSAREKTLNEMNSALALTLYQMAIDKSLSKLSSLDKENPFVYLAIYQSLPRNYQGTVNTKFEIDKSGWYYDLETHLVYYLDRFGHVQKYNLKFEFEDRNNSGKFEYLYDSISNLSIKKAS